jgi:hypothetical protein
MFAVWMLDVSCSPYRVPVAKLAAANAALQSVKAKEMGEKLPGRSPAQPLTWPCTSPEPRPTDGRTLWRLRHTRQC